MLLHEKINSMYFELDIDGLSNLEEDLKNQKLASDRAFSDFLSAVTVSEMNYETPKTGAWKKYKQMLVDYEYLTGTLALCTFYKNRMLNVY